MFVLKGYSLPLHCIDTRVIPFACVKKKTQSYAYYIHIIKIYGFCKNFLLANLLQYHINKKTIPTAQLLWDSKFTVY